MLENEVFLDAELHLTCVIDTYYILLSTVLGKVPEIKKTVMRAVICNKPGSDNISIYSRDASRACQEHDYESKLRKENVCNHLQSFHWALTKELMLTPAKFRWFPKNLFKTDLWLEDQMIPSTNACLCVLLFVKKKMDAPAVRYQQNGHVQNHKLSFPPCLVHGYKMQKREPHFASR